MSFWISSLEKASPSHHSFISNPIPSFATLCFTAHPAYMWVAVEIMFMANWPCPNWVVPYRLWRFWISWVFTIWSDQGFRGCSIVMGCWSLVSPGLLADRVFSLACPGFALRASSFNSGPCVGVSSRCWHSLRCLLAVPLCSCCTCPSQSVKQVVQQFMGKLPRPEIARWNWIRFAKVWGMSFSEHETIYERYR